MADIAAVRRYARALFDTAQRAGLVDQVEEDLKLVDTSLRATPQLLRALRAPTIPGERKKELVERVFASRIAPVTRRLLNLVVDRRREDILGQIYLEFQRIANEARGVLPIEVTSAVPLTDEERLALTTAVQQHTGKRVQMKVAIDPALMGGVVVRMADTVIDGSVRSRLAQLKSRLLAGRVA